eukprot:TRINITY_DN48439_c0_g1_i1.p1 TRINITY_DN48439_c0_g1~~TRINITY_DN48439_c0_g1_i1.p1  ORF type:complete len:192 (+),score=70.89 TRINITY_DN48439_c0_g1_i1:42-578(+)
MSEPAVKRSKSEVTFEVKVGKDDFGAMKVVFDLVAEKVQVQRFSLEDSGEEEGYMPDLLSEELKKHEDAICEVECQEWEEGRLEEEFCYYVSNAESKMVSASGKGEFGQLKTVFDLVAKKVKVYKFSGEDACEEEGYVPGSFTEETAKHEDAICEVEAYEWKELRLEDDYFYYLLISS